MHYVAFRLMLFRIVLFGVMLFGVMTFGVMLFGLQSVYCLAPQPHYTWLLLAANLIVLKGTTIFVPCPCWRLTYESCNTIFLPCSCWQLIGDEGSDICYRRVWVKLNVHFVAQSIAFPKHGLILPQMGLRKS